MAERRAVNRYELSFRIIIRVLASNFVASYVGKTIDISSKGLHFVLKCGIDSGTAIEFTIVPPEYTGAAHIRGCGRVLRIDRSHENSFGIAASIEQCEISRAPKQMIELRRTDLLQ